MAAVVVGGEGVRRDRSTRARGGRVCTRADSRLFAAADFHVALAGDKQAKEEGNGSGRGLLPDGWGRWCGWRRGSGDRNRRGVAARRPDGASSLREGDFAGGAFGVIPSGALIFLAT